MGYMKRWGTYRLRLTKDDLKEKKVFIKELLENSYDNFK